MFIFGGSDVGLDSCLCVKVWVKFLFYFISFEEMCSNSLCKFVGLCVQMETRQVTAPLFELYNCSDEVFWC